MSDLIAFLERMGADSQLRFAAEPALEEALAGAGVAPSARSAVLSGDQLRLESLVGASKNICNLVNFPEDMEDD